MISCDKRVVGVLCVLAITTRAVALCQAESGFNEEIGSSASDSTPQWPEPVRAPKGAPNVVLILLDDVGFGAASTFGGPAMTPALDELAAHGLRYNNFNTTALCSPTRASLLTGRNSHAAGFGAVTENSSGYPGYNSIWKKSTASVAEILRRNGYSTAAFGKWHNTPVWEMGPTGPFDRWPTGLGFEYFYGFMSGGTSQWEPSLFRNTIPVSAPATPAQGYHLTTDLVDEAIRWRRIHESLAPEKPYFLYFAPGATHSPHHVPEEWIRKYRGRFDRGWDELREEIFKRQKHLGVIPANAKLTLRPKELKSWQSFSPAYRKLLARQMEVYAAFLEHTDHEIGRLLEAVQHGPSGDNTLIVYIVGDNGGDAFQGETGSDTFSVGQEPQSQYIDRLGGPTLLNNYSAGWAWASSTPFQWMKGVASHFGGTRNPMVLSWPARIKKVGTLRTQFSHVNDVAATLYEVAGIVMPTEVDGIEQRPIDGISLAYTFDDPSASPRHRTQYFEQIGNRGIYHDGWMASARHGVPWVFPKTGDFAADGWELYHLDEDFSQAHDIAASHSEKLRQLQSLFDLEARRNDVYPLSTYRGNGLVSNPPWYPTKRQEYVFYPGVTRIEWAIPDLSNCRLTANVVIPNAGVEGMIISNERPVGGFALYVRDGRLVYESNAAERGHQVITSDSRLPSGEVQLVYEFEREISNAANVGTGRLRVNGDVVGEARIAPTRTWGNITVGQADVSLVIPDLKSPFKFTGELKRVIVNCEAL